MSITEAPPAPRPRVVVVTGANAGVGRAVSRAFARRGWALGLLARGEDALEETVRQMRAAGAAATLAIPTDTAEAGAVLAAADRIAREFGPPDVWVNDAMATVFGPVHATTPEEFRRVTEVTYLGYVHGTLAALRHMRPRNRGTIVQVGSALAYRAIPLQAPYCAAKFAIRGFTDSLRCELRHDRSRIRLTMVQLPAVNTPQFDWARSHMPRRARPMGAIHQPEAVAEQIYRAALRAPRELWVGWPTVQAILGTMLAPSMLDGMMARTAVDGQMTEEPEQPGRPDNLLAPVPCSERPWHRMHGRFDSEATDRVPGFDPGLLRLALGGAAALALASGLRGLR
ncbi:MAG TPA: SDR family oxidoreductase [Crenalkalicoccus sp.]|jgi:NAD(P)-dependent dehydrogenase (short-subunit alcohol dehydrogenase family)|nr:SDR family oxidoreductase [Crenalkalicoccus sp.]